jgi:hypothetical protein
MNESPDSYQPVGRMYGEAWRASATRLAVNPPFAVA